MITCYIDESGTDSNSSVAVVGGVLFDMEHFFWLDVEWRKCLKIHNIPWPLHMMEFGLHGKLGYVKSDARRALFKDLTKIVNDTKKHSVGCYMSANSYKKAFGNLSQFSMYGAAFLVLVLAMTNAPSNDPAFYPNRIAYLLDSGNKFKRDVLDSYDFLVSRDDPPPTLGPLSFDRDDNVAALQAADMLSWSIRRKGAEGLKSGFEPLEALLDPSNHAVIEYSEDDMRSIADDVRAKLKP